MKFQKKSKTKTEIPTASMPDIIFMLLIFFMVSTVLKQYEGLKVVLPEAQKITKLKGSKRNISTIWVNQEKRVVIDDVEIVDIKKLRTIVWQKLNENVQIKISLKADKNVDMGIVSDVHQELRQANALRLVYSAIPN
jgi:biopolymer transport protein ExbD